ncbi:TPA: phage repressor protein CI [Yersinia enterocolitica]|nr:phage repressor protein CI [Yersinia enterocolitica]
MKKMKLFDPNGGGRDAIERAIKAFGLNKRTELSERTGISIATIATWWKRDFYPANLLIGCALETGVSLRWLATGNGPMYDDAKDDVIALKSERLFKGKLEDSGYRVIDKRLLEQEIKEAKVILYGDETYIVDCSFEPVIDGVWLVEIEGQTSIRTLELIPVGKVRVSSSELKSPFECALSDIKVLARVDSVLKKV